MQETKTLLPDPSSPFGKCRSLLFEELSSRRRRNPVYSLRAFARDLDLSPTVLSDVLAEKRRFSKKNALKVAGKLSLKPSETEMLLRELETSRSTSKEPGAPVRNYRLIDDDTFTLLSDWYYYAILNLATLEDNRSDAHWIAGRLNLDLLDVRCALERLTRMKLLEVKDGKLKRTTLPMLTTKDVPSAAIRKFHRQALTMAEKSLERDPLELRMFAAVTVGANLEKLQEAKELIRETRDRVAKLLGTGKRTEVYTLAIQLFPVSRRIGNV